MRKVLTMMLAAAVAGAGLTAGASAWMPAPAAMQVDPWDKARYLIDTLQSAEALAIIDSGQFDINMANDEGYTLLHFAAATSDLALVKALLARGADPNAKTDGFGLTPYQRAYSTLIKAELRKAMAAGARPAPAANGSAAPAPAAAAGGNGMCEMARNDPANNGRSLAERPFLAAKDAVWYNHPDELAGLIEDCVKVDSQDQYGWTLLHHAADRDRVALARILIDKGASKAIRNKDGQTAPMLAKSAEMKALLGPAGPKPAAAGGNAGRDKECQQKYQADAALCSDSTCRMRSMRKWQQCLKTGNYW